MTERSGNDDGDVKHTEEAATSGTWRLACHPLFRFTLFLSTGEPARHAVRAPHGSTEALLADAVVGAVLVVVCTHLLQLAVGRTLHAADAWLKLLKWFCKNEGGYNEWNEACVIVSA